MRAPMPNLSRALLAVAMLATAPALAAQDEAPPLFVDKIDVSIVNVEVFVTDDDGKRVVGLGLGDFEILEDGQPVEITNFFATSRPDRLLRSPEAGQPQPAERPKTGARPVLPPDQQLNLIVYVDHFNLRPANRRRLLDELDGFLEDRLIQGDNVMLIGAYRTAEVVTPLTRNRRQIDEGLARLGRAATYRQVDDAQRRRVMRQMNSAALEGELESAIQFVRSYVQGARHDLDTSAAALRRVVRSLAGLPGRKAVLYVSEGLPQRPGEELYQDLLDRFGIRSIREAQLAGVRVNPSADALGEDASFVLDDIAREANAHQATLYPIDATGPVGAPSLSSEHPSVVGGTMGNTGLDAMLANNLQEPLIDMAEATGGRTVLGTFAFEEALTDVADDFDSFYSLGYQSSHRGDGEFHDIVVRVKRSGLAVRHRSGFIDKPMAERVADRTLASVLFNLEANPLGVGIDFGRPKKAKRGRFLLPVLVRVPLSSITLLPSGAGAEGRLRFYLSVQDEDGAVSDMHRKLYPVTLEADQLAEARGREMGYAVDLLVRPGLAKVGVGVWDEVSDSESFLLKQIRVE